MASTMDITALEQSTLPDWLSPHANAPLPTYPRTKEQIAINEMVYQTIFETVLDLLVEGKSVKSHVQSDPRQISYGRFMQWVKKDTDRLKRYREAQAIGTEVMAEEMKEISDGDGLEDVQRSTLRVNTRKWLMQSWNKERYGNEKDQPTPFGVGGITVVIGDVKPQGVVIDQHVERLTDVE